MYILDTDHLSLIQRNGAEGRRILEGLEGATQVAVTVITYEEQIRDGSQNCIYFYRTKSYIADSQSIRFWQNLRAESRRLVKITQPIYEPL